MHATPIKIHDHDSPKRRIFERRWRRHTRSTRVFLAQSFRLVYIGASDPHNPLTLEPRKTHHEPALKTILLDPPLDLDHVLGQRVRRHAL